MSERSHYVGIDWGSTNARALLFTPDDRLVEEREEPLGIKRVPAGGLPAAFAAFTSAWRERHGPIPVLLSGMIGSRQGWHEAPYLSCPVILTELHRSLVPVPGVTAATIVPGLSFTCAARSDVMRGEELQLLGLGERAAAFDWVCIPGTHSKWVRAEWPVVREFHTAMTGEMFAAIAEHTLFANLISPQGAAAGSFAAAAFEQGLDRSAAPHGVLNTLFGIRADVLLGRIATDEIRDLISGLLIGTEIRHILGQAPAKSRVAVLAARELQTRYLRALTFFNLAATAFAVSQITADGFVALMRRRRAGA
ncbi:MAG: 2-dehydro-3-deoxygalactonokinase [Opitutaceae bacterium]